MPVFGVVDGDVLELTLQSQYQGQQVRNVFHYRAVITGGPVSDGPAELADLGTLFNSQVVNPVGDPWSAKLVDTYLMINERLQIVHPIRKPYIDDVADAWAGAFATQGMPSDTNLTISLRTLVVGRGLTGNKKLTGMPVATVDGNEFTAGMIESAQLFGNRMTETITSTSTLIVWQPIVWSPGDPFARRDVWDAVAQTEVRVLRRRQKGVGI